MDRMVMRGAWKAVKSVHVARRCLSTQKSTGASSKGAKWTKIAAVSESQAQALGGRREVANCAVACMR